MVMVISIIKVKEGEVDAFIDLFKAMIEPTRQEAGCIQYEMHQDVDVPSTLVAVETWETRDAFEGHLISDHFKKIAPAMEDLMDGETDITICRRVA